MLSGCGVVGVEIGAGVDTEAQGVIAGCRGGIVLEFEDIEVVLEHPGAGASSSKCAGDDDGGGKEAGCYVGADVTPLEMQFVEHARADDEGVAKLEGVLLVPDVHGLLGQVERAHAGPGFG